MFFSKKKFPSTEILEQEEKQKVKLYQEFVETQNSELLKEYLQLHDELSSPTFKVEKEKITKLTYKRTDNFVKEKEFAKLQKNKALKRYFETAGSSELKEFTAFKDSEGYSDIHDAKKRKEDAKLAAHYRFENSKMYRNFKEVNNSPMLKRYTDLKEFLASEEHKDFKTYCNDSKRYEKSDYYKKEKRFEELASSDAIKNYLAYKDGDYFEEQKNWELVYEEEFTGNALEAAKWVKSYYWARKLGDNLYSSENEFQAFDGKNIELNKQLRLHTKKEAGKGKFWDSSKGFIVKDTDYTSAILSSSVGFEQKEGKLKLKVKLEGNASVNHQAWLSTEKNDRSMVLFKSQDKNVLMGTLTKNGTGVKQSIAPAKKLSLYSDYYIISVEWNEKNISWKVNNVEIKTDTNNMGTSPKHLILNSTVADPKKAGNSKMMVDWIRSYSKKQA